MSREDLRFKLDKYRDWADKINELDDQDMKVPVKEFIGPLNYCLGAAMSLLGQVEKHENDIKDKFVHFHNLVDSLRKDRQREATLACRRGDLINKYRQVVFHIGNHWLKSRKLKNALASLKEFEKRNPR